MSADFCICCGETIPEGRFACYGCERNTKKNVYQKTSPTNEAKEDYAFKIDCAIGSTTRESFYY